MDLAYAVDLSSFFLVESSGDSEEDFDSVVSMGYNSASSPEEDYAESCCGSSDAAACMEDCSEIDDEEDRSSKGDVGYEQEYYESHNVEDESWVCQDVFEDVSKSTQSDKQKKQLAKNEEDARMSEEEENRLFWESCLAE